MINPQTIGHFDRVLTFQSPTKVANTSGESVLTWANTYTNVKAKEMLHTGGETFEANQQVWKRSRKFIIRKQGYTITQYMRFLLDNIAYNVTDVQDLLNNRLYYVVIGEARDND
jgi:SPP1 family predicted phage head-tail adaptor